MNVVQRSDLIARRQTPTVKNARNESISRTTARHETPPATRRIAPCAAPISCATASAESAHTVNAKMKRRNKLKKRSFRGTHLFTFGFGNSAVPQSAANDALEEEQEAPPAMRSLPMADSWGAPTRNNSSVKVPNHWVRQQRPPNFATTPTHAQPQPQARHAEPTVRPTAPAPMRTMPVQQHTAIRHLATPQRREAPPIRLSALPPVSPPSSPYAPARRPHQAHVHAETPHADHFRFAAQPSEARMHFEQHLHVQRQQAEAARAAATVPPPLPSQPPRVVYSGVPERRQMHAHAGYQGSQLPSAMHNIVNPGSQISSYTAPHVEVPLPHGFNPAAVRHAGPNYSAANHVGASQVGASDAAHVARFNPRLHEYETMGVQQLGAARQGNMLSHLDLGDWSKQMIGPPPQPLEWGRPPPMQPDISPRDIQRMTLEEARRYRHF